MALMKTTRCYGRKPIVKQERQQALQSLWELDNYIWEDFISLVERQLWDIQDKLLALQEVSKDEQLSIINKAIKLLYLYSG